MDTIATLPSPRQEEDALNPLNHVVYWGITPGVYHSMCIELSFWNDFQLTFIQA
jgi:hypothetical protein